MSTKKRLEVGEQKMEFEHKRNFGKANKIYRKKKFNREEHLLSSVSGLGFKLTPNDVSL